jgi:hypothetical protein
MEIKVYVSCYIPSIKQTVMRILQLRADSTILEARDHILTLLGLGEKKVLASLGLEREEYLFSGTQMYVEALHTHIDILHIREQQKLEPCYTLQEEFMRHEHRSPKSGDIFKLRLVLPRFDDEVNANEKATKESKAGRKRNLDEANHDAGPSSFPLCGISMPIMTSMTMVKSSPWEEFLHSNDNENNLVFQPNTTT